MVDAEDLWKEVVDTNNPKDKLLKSIKIDKTIKEDKWGSEGSEGELDYYDIDNIGDSAEEEDTEEEDSEEDSASETEEE